MNCERAESLIAPFLDGALRHWRRWGLARHLAACPSCAHALDDARRQADAMRIAIPRHRAPPALAARIGTTLAREASHATPRAPGFRAAWRTVAPAAAALLLGVALGAGTNIWNSGASADDIAARLAVDSHLRALASGHLMDIEASDRHQVKPWLAAHGMISPPLRDLSAAGYVLAGGRMDYLDGQQAAVAIYRRGAHTITLFATPAAGPDTAPGQTQTQQGFHLLSWRQDGMRLLLVADIEPMALANFARALRAPSG
jgi:anti-sigma factor RsiW